MGTKSSPILDGTTNFRTNPNFYLSILLSVLSQGDAFGITQKFVCIKPHLFVSIKHTQFVRIIHNIILYPIILIINFLHGSDQENLFHWKYWPTSQHSDTQQYICKGIANYLHQDHVSIIIRASIPNLDDMLYPIPLEKSLPRVPTTQGINQFL